MPNLYEQLMLKSLQGTITSAEQQVLDDWLNESENNKSAFRELSAVWRLTGNQLASQNFNTPQEWERFEANLGGETEAATPDRFRYWMKIAAAVTLMLVSSYLVFISFAKREATTVASANDTMFLRLPDGSRLTLNKGARISYTKDFDEGRSLHLEGEAFFDVVRDPARPFVIYTPSGKLEVLGTSFNVDSRRENTALFVVTGKVKFSNIAGTIAREFVAGEGGLSENNVITEFSQENATAWKEKRLQFRKTALEDVVSTLERYYHIDIDIKNANLLSCRFTSSFNNPQLAEVIEALSVSMNLNIVRNGDVYVIDGEGCNL
jgi:transmembrane sensor